MRLFKSTLSSGTIDFRSRRRWCGFDKSISNVTPSHPIMFTNFFLSLPHNRVTRVFIARRHFERITNHTCYDGRDQQRLITKERGRTIHEIEFQTATKYEKLFKWRRERNKVANILEAETLTWNYLLSWSLDLENETRFQTNHSYQTTWMRRRGVQLGDFGVFLGDLKWGRNPERYRPQQARVRPRAYNARSWCHCGINQSTIRYHWTML